MDNGFNADVTMTNKLSEHPMIIGDNKDDDDDDFFNMTCPTQTERFQ